MLLHWVAYPTGPALFLLSVSDPNPPKPGEPLNPGTRPPIGDIPPPAQTAPEPGLASLIYKPLDFFRPLDLGAIFKLSRPLEVELGAGDGSFLVRYAQSQPDCNFLGVERLLGRLRKIDRKGRRAGLTNLRVMRVEAAYFLEYLLPPGSTRALHVYFPDPWPKRKHRRKRLVNERFPGLARRVLQTNGMVCLRTDDADYFDQMRTVFGADPGFCEAEIPPALAGVITDFERDFHARGVRTLSIAYRLTGKAG